MLLSTTIVDAEPNNTKAAAQTFAFPADGVVVLRGTSVNHDDKDFFRFTATTSARMAVKVNAVDGVFAQLEIERPNGVDIFETEPNDGVNSGVVNLVAGQTYFIRLRAPGNGAAQYAARLVLNPGSGGGGTGGGGALPSKLAESENNNTKARADAFKLNANGVARLTGRSVNQDDRDFFVFTASKNGSLQVTVTNTGGATAKLEIETAGGLDVFETQPSDGINSGVFNVRAGKTYFVRLRAPGATPASYDVLFKLT